MFDHCVNHCRSSQGDGSLSYVFIRKGGSLLSLSLSLPLLCLYGDQFPWEEASIITRVRALWIILLHTVLYLTRYNLSLIIQIHLFIERNPLPDSRILGLNLHGLAWSPHWLFASDPWQHELRATPLQCTVSMVFYHVLRPQGKPADMTGCLCNPKLSPGCLVFLDRRQTVWQCSLRPACNPKFQHCKSKAPDPTYTQAYCPRRGQVWLRRVDSHID